MEMLEDELDDVVNWLMENAPKAETASELMNVSTFKGKAQGLATAIAIIQAPYYPNVDSVRADSVRRYEWRKAHPPSWSSAGSRASETDELESGAE